MKKWLLALMAVGMIAVTTSADVVIYVTGAASNIRRTADFGNTWDNFKTVSGAGFFGIDAAIVNGETNIFAYARSGSSPNFNGTIYAFAANGTQLDTAAINVDNGSNRRPVGYFNGYLYANILNCTTTPNRPDGYSSWNGTAFGNNPIALAQNSQSWQADDMAFVTLANGTSYQYVNGSSGLVMRRRTVVGNGTLSDLTGNLTLTGLSGSNIYDLTFTPSNRLLVLTGDGFYVTAPGVAGDTSFTFNQILAFSSAENPATGDMGPNGRDFKLYLGTIYAVTQQYLYRYTYDDTTGTISYVTGSASLHGLNNNGVQIAVIPEPGVVWLIGFGIFAARKLRRHV